MPPKIIFSDIDGTLLNAQRETSPALRTQVTRLTAQDIPFILISSRMPAAMTHLQADLGISGQPMICYNGGWVLAGGEPIHSTTISLDLAQAIVEWNPAAGLSVQLFHADEWYVGQHDHYADREQRNTKVIPTLRPLPEVLTDWQARQIAPHKIMVMGSPTGLDALVAYLEGHFPNALHLYRSKDDYLEIAARSISKLTGVEVLLRHAFPGLTLADCLAFGDNYNDLEMLAAVGTGIAVANAKAEVLAVADFVVATNREDGVAQGLARFFPGEMD